MSVIVELLPCPVGTTTLRDYDTDKSDPQRSAGDVVHWWPSVMRHVQKEL